MSHPQELNFINGVLHFGDIDLSKQETPCFVFSKKQLQLEIDSFKKNILEALPNTSFYYSTKTNPSKFVIETMVENDLNFVVSSVNEAKLLIELGVDPKKCLTNQPLYTKKDIQQYAELGIELFVLGDEEYIEWLNDLNKNLKYMTLLNLVGKEHSIAIDYKNIPRIVEKNVNTKFLGLAFYVKTQNTEVFLWQSYIAKVFSIIEYLKQNNIQIETINIGSGFPVEYNKSGMDYTLVIDRIKNTLEKLKEYKIIVEPGRSLVASSIVLLSKVLQVKNNDVWMNCSVYNTYLDTPISKIKLPCLNTNKKNESELYNVFGNTPCTLDIFFKDRQIDKIQKNDILCFYNAGAYIFQTNFVQNKVVKFI